jgi:hypothetical protein
MGFSIIFFGALPLLSTMAFALLFCKTVQMAKTGGRSEKRDVFDFHDLAGR